MTTTVDSDFDRRWPISLALGLILAWILLIGATSWLWLHEFGDGASAAAGIGAYLFYPVVVGMIASRSKSPGQVLRAGWLAALATMVVATFELVPLPTHAGLVLGFGRGGALVGAAVVSTVMYVASAVVARSTGSRAITAFTAICAMVLTAIVSFFSFAII